MPETFYASTGVSWTFFFIVALFVITIGLYERRRKGLRLPQFAGPSGLPIIGNLFEVRHNAAVRYKRWAQEYGDVIQVQLGDLPVLVVNSAAAAKAIFVGHSNALCSRPVLFTFHKIVSKSSGPTMGTSPYSRSLNRSKKAAQLGKPAIKTYIPHLDIETRTFMLQCLRSNGFPIDPLLMLKRLSLSLNLQIYWGRRVELSDELLSRIVETEHELVNLRNCMTNMQDCVPVLRRTPFNGVTRKAKDLKDKRDAYFEQLNRELDEALLRGERSECMRAQLLSSKEVGEEDLNMICRTMVSAGLAPLVATLQWSIALLAQRPDIQVTAYGAIREHYGTEVKAFGDVDDDQGCQYVVALIREFLRYFTVARTSLPRSTAKEFFYQGKVIPVGTTLLLNAWACNMDPVIYWTPEVFDPTRYLQNPDLVLFSFGIGSRSCSGTSLANRLMYLFFIRLISAFEIAPGSTTNCDPVAGCKKKGDLVSVIEDYTVCFRARGQEVFDAIIGGKKVPY